MKINEILTEDVGTPPFEVAQILIQDCSPFLAEINYDLYSYKLWRGAKKLDRNIELFQTNKFRKPVDMPPAVSEAIDDYFEEKTGARWRSTSVFASGNPSAARYYGNLFCLFPIGEFHYCWSPRVSDLFNNVDRKLGNYGLKYQNFKVVLGATGEEEHPEDREIAFETLTHVIMPSFAYQVDTGLTEAIAMASSEVMIRCDKYYLVSSKIMSDVSMHVSMHKTVQHIYGPEK